MLLDRRAPGGAHALVALLVAAAVPSALAQDSPPASTASPDAAAATATTPAAEVTPASAEPPVVAPVVPPRRTLPTELAERYRLENGLEVVLDPVDEETVTVCVVYHSGAADQPVGYTGLAHLSEHVMFEGSTHAPRHFLDELDVLGVLDVNGTTERDRTRYYEVVMREHLERVLFLEADRMAFLLDHLGEGPVETQREVVLRELEERVDLGGLGLIPGLIASVLYTAPGHPYADLVEHRDDISALRLPHVQWFMSRHYAPENATLVVTGGFETEAARAMIERWFGPIRRVGEPPPEIPAPEIVRLPHERRIVVEAPLRRDQLRVSWPTPPRGSPEEAALDLVAEHIETRLEEELLDTHLATGVWAADIAYEHAGELSVDVITQRRDGTLVALEAIDRALLALQATPLSEAELAAIVGRMINAEVARLESGTDRALLLGSRIRRAEGGHWSLAWAVERWRAVTPAELQRIAVEWLPQRQRLVLSIAATRDAPYQGRVVVDLTLGPDGEEIAP